MYRGRVPALIHGWLRAIQGQNTPAVCVVVYGNRAYENALLELTDFAAQSGCIPLAGAAYIGEHCFSHASAPVAQGRPDADDTAHAQDFGRKIREKLRSIDDVSRAPRVAVPRTRSYGGVTELWSLDFSAVDHSCVQYGSCAKLCPVSAIAANDSSLIDQEKCITCCACVKGCPNNARTMKPGPVLDASHRLHEFHGQPKPPQCFL